MTAPFLLEALAPHNDRKGFSCSIEALDRYFAERVTQDVRRRLTACYVAIEAATSQVAGFYTLAAAGIPLGELPESIVNRLPRYPSIPVARLGRLAVDHDYRGQGLGSAMLWDAITLARALNPCLAVIDEKRGRRVAHSVYGLPVKGTAGLLVEASRRGLLTNLRTTLLDLKQAGYYLSDAVVEGACKSVDAP